MRRQDPGFGTRFCQSLPLNVHIRSRIRTEPAERNQVCLVEVDVRLLMQLCVHKSIGWEILEAYCRVQLQLLTALTVPLISPLQQGQSCVKLRNGITESRLGQNRQNLERSARGSRSTPGTQQYGP